MECGGTVLSLPSILGREKFGLRCLCRACAEDHDLSPEKHFGLFARRGHGRIGVRCGKAVVGRPVCEVTSHDHRACRETSRGHHALKALCHHGMVSARDNFDCVRCHHDMVSGRDSFDCGHDSCHTRVLDF